MYDPIPNHGKHYRNESTVIVTSGNLEYETGLLSVPQTAEYTEYTASPPEYNLSPIIDTQL